MEPVAGPGNRFAMRNWRVATRLNAILLIPVLVALVFGGFRVQSSVRTWRDADDAVRIAQLVRAAVTYATTASDERDVAVIPLLKGDAKNAQVLTARAATDKAKSAFDTAVSRMPQTTGLQKRVQLVRDGEKKLASLRAAAFTRKLPGVQTEEGYLAVTHPLIELSNELGFGSANQASFGRTLYAISLTQAAESLTRSIGTHILAENRNKLATGELDTQLTALSSYAYLQGIAIEEFKGGGTDQDVAELQRELTVAAAKGKQQLTAAAQQAAAAGQTFVAPPETTAMIKEIASGKSATQLAAEGITLTSWFATSTLGFDAYRNVGVYLSDSALSDAQHVASSARTDAIANSAIVLVALIVAFIVAALMARTMSRSMRRLRNAAFDVAEQRLPALVEQLSRTDPGRVDTRIQAIPITSKDEIGEVARAFDQVHREAVRLAAEQALLRGNVNAIFTNLSRRNQGLIQRQLSLITELENNEGDPDQLENLFKMDHLATRMRRNGENLLVLAGEEPGRRWNQPVPLVDVLRAAASEVESYERIELIGIPETEIHGTAVTDMVHLLAELLENATTFSSPQTKVRVTATRLPDGRVMIEIHDKGIGLTAEDFADINHKLAEPPTVDASISKRMGLFVVGRLADRHSIRVQLRPSGEQAGTTSLVMLPEPITHGGGGEEQLPEDDNDFTVSRIVPEHDIADYAYQPSAADLGFDDSRYEQIQVPDDARALDPVGRSLMRKERRAQLEASTGERTGEQPLPAFLDEAPVQHPYESFEGGYQEQGYVEPVAYQEPQYEQTPQPDGYPAQDGYGAQDEWQQQGYPVPAQDEWASPAPARPAQPEHQEWTAAAGTAPYQPQQPQQQPQQAESAPGGAFEAPERVGFQRPGPAPGATHSLTGSGLPRRDRNGSEQPEEAAQAAPEQEESTQWRSANDDNWQRAEQAREPKAGGVTPSGLPRRVPKANLVAGAAQQTPQSGPQVSRAPEEIRGRLSNLRRGVQQGRNAGTDTNGQGFGPNHQER
jgi:signal transduction histidine kinase